MNISIKQITNDLKISQDKYNMVFSNSTDSILLLKVDKIVEINPSGCRMFGYTNKALSGSSLISLLDESDKKTEEILEFVNKGSSSESGRYEIKLIKKNGEVFSAEVNLSIHIGNDDYNVLAIIRDISARIAYEKSLIDAKEKANELSRIKSLSLASMSHELRTPLNSIIGFSDLLLDDETTEDEKEMFSKLIRSAGKSLMQLIGDIVDISKIEAGQVTIKKESLNVNSFLQELLLTFRQEKENQGKKDIELKMVLSDKVTDLKIKTDPHRLQQIFNNLLNNSLKFIDDGFIEFGYLSITPDFIQFYVKDTGIGIDSNKREKIFEEFGRDSSIYNRNPDGTGLGLAISKSFVELLGGRIWLDSEIDSGTTFYFTLPFENKNLINRKIIESFGKDGLNWSNRTIVIADDVEENYVFLKGVLVNTGINIFWAKDGQEALELCDNHKVDLVLMDIRMPVMDGFEASKFIKDKHPDVVIIAQTAFASPEDKAECIKSGCDEYFKKPINHEELFKAISKYLK